MAAINPNFNFHFSKFTSIPVPNPIPTSLILPKLYKLRTPHAISNSSDPQPNPNSNSSPVNPKNEDFPVTKPRKPTVNPKNEDFPVTKPRKPRRGRKSEAVAVEDFIRDTIEKTFASIREQNPELVIDMENIIKEKVDDGKTGVGEDKGEEDIVEEEKSDWPLDTEVGWGIRASDYFEKYPIKNVVGEDGVEIDWEGEMDDTFVKEINCLEWEKFAFHPSPLIVLVFERYKRASDNWKALTELEKAATVYWEAKDRLPPRTVKIDINIETDLAYALKVKETPQILFLRGNRILHREKQIRTSDELVEMIAHFYYKARKPSFMKVAT